MKLKPELNAMYGDKGVVGNYLVGEVLTLLGLDMNEGLIVKRTQDQYSKDHTGSRYKSKVSSLCNTLMLLILIS
ncbi:MAG: hypothetical protein IPI91_19120 [Flavobacteriales bacterium]|nr:hypothetical protein [Flavobacteriales bacterium]